MTSTRWTLLAAFLALGGCSRHSSEPPTTALNGRPTAEDCDGL